MENIDIGKTYNLNFYSTWSSFNGDYRVIGITVPSAIEDVQSGYKLYPLFFEDLGLGISTYTSYIKSDTQILICNKVVGYGDAIEYEDEKTFIPVSLIDFNESNEIVEVYEYKFVLSNIRRNFSSDDEKDTYERNIINEFKDEVMENDKFASSSASVQFAANKTFVSKDDADKIANDTLSVSKEYSMKRNSENKYVQTKISDLQKTVSYLNSKSTEIFNMLSEYKDLSIAVTGETTNKSVAEIMRIVDRSSGISDDDKENIRRIIQNIIDKTVLYKHVEDGSSLNPWDIGNDPGDIREYTKRFEPGMYIVQKTFN